MNVQKYKGFMVITTKKNPLCDSVIQINLHLYKGAKVPNKNQKRKLMSLIYAHAVNDTRKEQELKKLLQRLNLNKDSFRVWWCNWYKPSNSQIFFDFL